MIIPRAMMNTLALFIAGAVTAYMTRFLSLPLNFAELPHEHQELGMEADHKYQATNDQKSLAEDLSMLCKKFSVSRTGGMLNVVEEYRKYGNAVNFSVSRPGRSSPAAAAAGAAQGGVVNQEQDEKRTSPLTLFILACITLSFFMYASYQLIGLYIQYTQVIPSKLREFGTFKEYLQYRFDYWFAWTPGARGMIMLYIAVIIVMIGSAFYFLGVGSRLRTCMWKAMVWLIDPNAGAEEETSAGAAVGAVMSVCGLIVFAFLLTLLQESFAHYIDSLREGHSAVIERGHILLIGLTKTTIPIVQEFCMANAASGGAVIVVLAEHITKPEMEKLIQQAVPDKMGSRVVVRGGYPHHATDLKHVAADTASTILVMPDFTHAKETRDASITHTLITLHGQGWPTDGKLIAVCSLMRNKPILKRIGGPHAMIVILDTFVARLIVQCTNHFGIGRIVNKAFGFEGSEFYFTSVPEHVVGHDFVEASAYYPDAVLVGVVTTQNSVAVAGHGNLGSQRTLGAKGTWKYSLPQAHAISDKEENDKFVQLCPPMDYSLKTGDELVLIAEDSAGTVAKKKPCYKKKAPASSKPCCISN
jgi:hypothetical protein